MTLHRLRHRGARTALARVPVRPPAVSVMRPQMEIARRVGVLVDELDEQHVLLTYDARNRDQWLAVDVINDAVHLRSTIEGDGSFDSAASNWMVIHFDYGACSIKARKDAPDEEPEGGARSLEPFRPGVDDIGPPDPIEPASRQQRT